MDILFDVKFNLKRFVKLFEMSIQITALCAKCVF
jgi:hypothetical protein